MREEPHGSHHDAARAEKWLISSALTLDVLEALAGFEKLLDLVVVVPKARTGLPFRQCRELFCIEGERRTRGRTLAGSAQIFSGIRLTDMTLY